ncbi:hypothetical protein RN001_015286 [Aquatica leii]|uniref:DDE Tnp4 domain-containing protein n=1 Tax=Aquatica leii TaxID=1421715 RepID=A0AAN7SBZ8_9COLE|nr:hypothetical protein RN001_015286 [Aquatica leii]
MTVVVRSEPYVFSRLFNFQSVRVFSRHVNVMEYTTVFSYLLEEEEQDELLIMLEQKQKDYHPMHLTRDEEGFQNILIQRHLLKDDSVFRTFYWLNIDQLNYILSLIKTNLTKQSCGEVKHPISPDEKLGLTLSYISRIVKQVLKVCSKKLPPIFMPFPTREHFLKIAKEYEERWDFPNCISAVDGKNVRIFCPGKSGSQFFNYKNFFSVVLLAFVYAYYKFVMVDIGSYGKEGDSGIIEKSNIGRLIRNERFNPSPKHVGELILPHVVVGDEAFKLLTHMMKPYIRGDARIDNKKAIFNYRLSRARRVSENSIALLSQVFRIFYTLPRPNFESALFKNVYKCWELRRPTLHFFILN